MRLYTITISSMNPEMSYLVDISNYKKVRIELVIQRDPRMSKIIPRSEVADLCQARTRDLKLEGGFTPQLMTVGESSGRHVRFKYRIYLIRLHNILRSPTSAELRNINTLLANMQVEGMPAGGFSIRLISQPASSGSTVEATGGKKKRQPNRLPY